MAEKKLKLEIIVGVAGTCVSLGGRRIAGPKPWGGGEVVRSWDVERKQVLEALREAGDE